MKMSSLTDTLKLFGDCTRWVAKCGSNEGKNQFVNYIPWFHKEEARGPESVDEVSPPQDEFEGPTSINGHGPRQKDEMVAGGPWTGLIDDVLADIFDRLPFEDRLRTVPLVCKAWRKVSHSPASWRNVDMDPWMKIKALEDCDYEAEVEMDGIVQAVVDLSKGHLRQLCTGYCTNKSVKYIAENCPLLRELSIRNSFTVDDESAMSLSRRCNLLEKLDLSDCYTISAKSLVSFGVSCPSLLHFKRNMTDIFQHGEVAPPRGDEEAAAIATHMANLKELQMRRMTLTDSGLNSIARSCLQLENLDLACCTELSAQALNSVIDMCPKLRNFVKPIKARMHVADPKYCIPGLYMIGY